MMEALNAAVAKAQADIAAAAADAASQRPAKHDHRQDNRTDSGRSCGLGQQHAARGVIGLRPGRSHIEHGILQYVWPITGTD